MVYTPGLGPGGETLAGSSPVPGTTRLGVILITPRSRPFGHYKKSVDNFDCESSGASSLSRDTKIFRVPARLRLDVIMAGGQVSLPAPSLI
jgi:hypothetical protein